ncbi:MAG: HAF repeat-containing protein [Deltaproteobacteria bacterium]|nr:HAF repeat-containing protein [Deltaproteobacteria bacterium]
MESIVRNAMVCVLSTALIFAISPSKSLAVRYNVSDLGSLGGTHVEANAINNVGQVVGWSVTKGGSHGFVWNQGVMSDIGTLGGNFSEAVDINDYGQIVGWSHSSISDPLEKRAFLLSGQALKSLGTLGGDSSVALAINNAGAVVGRSNLAPGGQQRHAFLWDDGQMLDLGTLGGFSSEATDINELGQTVGYSETGGPASGSHAFLWENGIMRDLGTLGGNYSRATAINDFGKVVGESKSIGDRGQAFLWENGEMKSLEFPGPKFNSANYINNMGQVVGYSVIGSSYSESRAIIWEKGIWNDLNELLWDDFDWILTTATGINDAGQIICWGVKPVISSEHHAFLLSPGPDPIPESATGTLLGAGVLAIRVLRKKQRRKYARISPNQA